LLKTQAVGATADLSLQLGAQVIELLTQATHELGPVRATQAIGQVVGRRLDPTGGARWRKAEVHRGFLKVRP
jgi:hypothetical protein